MGAFDDYYWRLDPPAEFIPWASAWKRFDIVRCDEFHNAQSRYLDHQWIGAAGEWRLHDGQHSFHASTLAILEYYIDPVLDEPGFASGVFGFFGCSSV